MVQLKAEGNAALQAGNFTLAIEKYTAAIRADGSNHLYYSNRSAAYLSKGDAMNALEDAEACLGLNPDFAKGYSRKGAALHALKRYNDALDAYQKGLDKFPNDPGLTKGLGEVKRDKDAPPPSAANMGGAGLGGLFGPQMMAQMALNPKTRHYLNDADIMAKVKLLQSNPNLLPTMLSDPKMMTFLQQILGAAQEEDDQDPIPPKSTQSMRQTEPKREQESMEIDDEEDEDGVEDLTPEDAAKKDRLQKALKSKERGNELYKAKKFDEALAAYDEAIAYDDTNMTYLSNKAAVYFTIKKYDECIDCCEKAVQVGKENRAPFEDRAKALTRCAKAWQKKNDLGKAIEYCQAAQLESFDKETQRFLKTLELEKKKADTAAYLDEDKAEEAKARGNEFFRAKKWVEAVKEYEDAVKRSPRNAAIRNNLSAALCKILDINGAKREVEIAVDLDPTYVKAWARKGDIEVLLKENHKAIDSYRKGLSLDPNNAACKEGLRKVTAMLGSNMSEAEQKERAAHAMADPEIQAILNDPIMRQVLSDFNENPAAAQKAMSDPTVASKLEKLIASGVVQTR
jgi:stress-induced-phosphoprotein 1